MSAAPAKTVLLVDDNPANLGVLIDVLGKAGYRPLVAEDGERALHQMTHVQPDIVLLDVGMPGIDGFETCRRMKAQPGWADLPVLFMTARDDIVDKVAGFAAGAVDYITKPLQPDEVVARVKTHLRLRELQAELEEKNAELAERNERLAAAIRLREAAENALADSLDRAVVVTSREGEILFCTKRAARLLERHFPSWREPRLPPELRPGGPSVQASVQVTTLASAGGDAFHIVALEPVQPDPSPRELEPLGLTPREAEVLFWIAEGKTNPEIAVILGTSTNTVKRQSQAVFDKLGVENRTAATLRAVEVLRRNGQT
jgi:DNA-binding response OmpR family regulator/DNA-binding CsgD family transcriptional regulator